MLEKSSDKVRPSSCLGADSLQKYGDIQAYREYKENTPVFFPKLF